MIYDKLDSCEPPQNVPAITITMKCLTQELVHVTQDSYHSAFTYKSSYLKQ